jgi:anti-sigma factor RsiW
LAAGRIPRIESHLAECDACRALAAELRAEQALLGELRDQPLEDAMLAQVRQRVLAEVGVATRQPSRLYWKLALAAALVLTAILVWPRHAVKQTPAASNTAQAEAGSVPAAAHGAAPLARKVRHRRHGRTPAPQPGPPLLVQFVTDNPNIVVYWLVDQKPQGD